MDSLEKRVVQFLDSLPDNEQKIATDEILKGVSFILLKRHRRRYEVWHPELLRGQIFPLVPPKV